MKQKQWSVKVGSKSLDLISFDLPVSAQKAREYYITGQSPDELRGRCFLGYDCLNRIEKEKFTLKACV